MYPIYGLFNFYSYEIIKNLISEGIYIYPFYLKLKVIVIPEQPIDTTYHKIINKGHRMKTKLNRKKNMAKGLLILCLKMKQQLKGGWQSNFSAHYLALRGIFTFSFRAKTRSYLIKPGEKEYTKLPL